MLNLTAGILIGIFLTLAVLWYLYGRVPITTVPEEYIPVHEMKVAHNGHVDHVTRVDDDGVIHVEASAST